MLFASAMVLLLTGCGRRLPAQAAPPPPAVTVAHPIMHPVQTYFEYNGSLEAVEVVEITARVMGFLDEISFTEGDEVDRGELLFKIDPREYAAAVKKAQADQRRSSAELRLAELEEKRGKMLLETAAISEEDVQRRVAARETAEAAVMQTEAEVEMAKLQLGYTEIHSPITGQISRTHVTRGNLVGQTGNTLLTTILSMDPLYVYFDAPEKDLIEYQRALSGGEAPDWLSRTLPVEIGVATEDGYPHHGTIDFRENKVDPGTGTVRIRGRIANPQVAQGKARLLYPGLYARVRVPSGGPRMLAAIPEDALMTGQEGRFVYVLGSNNIVEKRTVTLGPTVWKDSATSRAAPWTLVPTDQAATERTNDSAASPEKPPAGAAPDKAESSAASSANSVVAIENGLTIDDQVVINGLTKARPGSPVTPALWQLKPPVTPASPQ